MNFKQLKNKIKEEQKELAQKITIVKSYRKPSSRDNVKEEHIDVCFHEYEGKLRYDGYKVYRMIYDYRHKHIAYCQFFNKTPYRLIEGKTRDDNRPNKHSIKSYTEKWENILDEAIRDCA